MLPGIWPKPNRMIIFLEMASSIPSASTKGFEKASLYDEHRPSYPPEAVTRFLKHLQVNGVKRARIVDLAAGTGKFTELLAGRNEGFEILAVEPHNGAYTCEQSLIKTYINLRAEFPSWPRSFPGFVV